MRSASGHKSFGRVSLLLALFAVLMACSEAVASARDMSRLSPVVIHPRLTLVPGSYFASDGRYVFIGASNFSVHGVGTVLDTRTGRRTSLNRPGCFPTAFADAWLALNCGPQETPTHELDNVVTGQIRPISTTGNPPNAAQIVGVGTQWVALEPPQGDYHVLPKLAFQNLQTGELRQDPRSARTNVDLNSPGLVTKVCRPVTVPEYQATYSSGDWGSLTPAGGYMVAASSNGMYLERCGTQLHQFLTFSFPDYFNSAYYYCPAFACPPAINAHEVLWRPHTSLLKGMFLPSRRRFTIALPAGFGAGGNLAMALVGTKLFLSVLGGGQPSGVWTIPTPVQPSLPKRHRR